MAKIITSLLLCAFTLNCQAANFYKFYTHVYGTFTLEVNLQSCLGQFNLNDYLLLSSEAMDSACEQNRLCPIRIYKGTSCSAEGLIGVGWTDLETGQLAVEGLDRHRYYFKGTPYNLGLHPYSPPG